MEISGWGRFPRVRAELIAPKSADECAAVIRRGGTIIARGLGRSYGDSSLGARVLDTRQLNHLLSFDPTTGILVCEAGVSLDDIVRTFVPKGWFPAVTPGTRYVTVGGAIAADVHGKNHHKSGCFSEQVISLELLTGIGERVQASRTENADLFHATCGGLGLTGVILSAAIKLARIRSSDIVATTRKAPSIEAALHAFAEHETAAYSVAWIDSTAGGRHLGRSLIFLGEHATDPAVQPWPRGGTFPLPMDAPELLLNRGTLKVFNSLYYRRKPGTRRTSLDSFFYPLDSLPQWNRLYGKAGFLQYQFVLPLCVGAGPLRSVLERIAASGHRSFLTVLKRLGPQNDNYLSFPLEGFTISCDFKVNAAVFQMLNELDRFVLDHGGRLYLAKDSRMSESSFKASYPGWRAIEAVRQRYHAAGRFRSTQSARLGLQ
jgi:FAD/FMN-containing dehydrogenase